MVSEVPETPKRRVVVATHGHCFDGAASAALFTRVIEHLETGPFAFSFKACGYGPNQNTVDPAWLDGEINAVLDFRYTQADQLTWYFDHHRTAFQGEGDREHFEARQAEGKRFHNETYGSCTRLVADVARERFGFHDPLLDPLVHWAEIIDSASFRDADQAVMRAEPELQLMSVLEHHGDAAMLERIIPRLAHEPLSDLALSAEVQEAWALLKPQHEAFVHRVRDKSVDLGRVVFVDLTEEVNEVVGKFVTYALFPDSSYSVIVSRGRTRCKISVGFNPWSKHPRTHDISAICSKYGGGGHPVVGAVSMAGTAVNEAREAAQAIAQILNS